MNTVDITKKVLAKMPKDKEVDTDGLLSLIYNVLSEENEDRVRTDDLCEVLYKIEKSLMSAFNYNWRDTDSGKAGLTIEEWAAKSVDDYIYRHGKYLKDEGFIE